MKIGVEPTVVVHVTGRNLLKSSLSHATEGRGICPGADCGLGVENIGLPSLAFTFVTCTCSHWSYPHLVEQLWHRECLVDS